LDTSRRGFLTNAAAITAVGTAMAMTAHIEPSEASTVPKRIPEENSFSTDTDIEPSFIETRIRIRDSLSEWRDVNADCNIRDRAVLEWKKRNPIPPYQPQDEESYGPSPRNDWVVRYQNAMRQAGLADIKAKRNELTRVYNAAVKEFAALDAVNLAELTFKANTADLMDSADGIISRSVVLGVLRFRRQGVWGNASNIEIGQVAP
jgi:hypothetical protein